jgi:dCMP deaminase
MVDFKWQKDDGKKTSKESLERPPWDEYFMKIAMLASERSTCVRHHVGAVVVKDKQILATGYNGAPKNVKDCFELGCLRNELKIPSGTQHEICRAIHAEQNAIIQAGNHGIKIDGGTMYCTHSPCVLCAKMVVNAGIKRFVTYSRYPDDSFMSLFKAAGIEFILMKKPEEVINTLD